MMTMTLQFPDRTRTDLDQLNAILAALKLDSLELENTCGYLATTRTADGTLVERRYGLDNCTLNCEEATGDAGLRYQMDTLVTEPFAVHDEVVQCWREDHPDRVVRIVQIAEYDDAWAFLIVHHQKV